MFKFPSSFSLGNRPKFWKNTLSAPVGAEAEAEAVEEGEGCGLNAGLANVPVINDVGLYCP